jgi:hypothetical protein
MIPYAQRKSSLVKPVVCVCVGIVHMCTHVLTFCNQKDFTKQAKGGQLSLKLGTGMGMAVEVGAKGLLLLVYLTLPFPRRKLQESVHDTSAYLESQYPNH